MRERARREQMFELASAPLLLSRIVLQPCGEGELPRDCPPLYQALIDLLLGEWDSLRGLSHLADLGDPRYPTTIAAWRQALERALTGDHEGYFCRLEAGIYWIGSDEHDLEAGPEERPLHRFELRTPLLMARYPITMSSVVRTRMIRCMPIPSYRNYKADRRLVKPYLTIELTPKVIWCKTLCCVRCALSRKRIY